MREQLQNRLDELKTEFARGQKQLEELDGQAANLRQMLLRISGAIQVLEEELAKEEDGGDAASGASDDAAGAVS